MKTLVLVFHPDLKNALMNQAVADNLELLPHITVRRLYDIYAKGTINVVKEQMLLEQADRIVFQFPFSWYSGPALLKEWQEEVLGGSWLAGEQKKRLAGKTLLAVTTLDPQMATDHWEKDDLLRPLQALAHDLGLCYHSPVFLEEKPQESRQEMEERVRHYVGYVLQPDPCKNKYEECTNEKG